jgi:hypothetical protein
MRMILSHMLNGISMYDSSAVCGFEKAMRLLEGVGVAKARRSQARLNGP